MATTPVTTLTIAQRIQALPQELHDMILDHTIAIPSPATLVLTPSYHPPLALQLDRRARADFAPLYYSTTTFRILVQQPAQEADRLMGKFLISLPVQHLTMLQRIEYEDLSPVTSQTWSTRTMAFDRLLTRRHILPPSVRLHLLFPKTDLSYIDVADGGKIKWIQGRS